MRAIPYALSIHHFINTVGADAGFAAIIGLAIVVLLFFAHARETATLRRRADESEEALHRLELYVDQIARAGVGPATAPAPAAAQIAAARVGSGAPVVARTVAPVPAPAGVLVGAPAAPAGVGAPALSAATRLIPAAGDDAISIRQNRRETTAQPVVAGQTTAAVMDLPAPGPSTSAAGANGGGVPRVAPPPSAGQTLGGRDRVAPLAAPRPAPATTPNPRRPGKDGGGSRIGRGAIVLATGLVVVAAVAVLLIVTSGGSKKNATASRGSRITTASGTHKRKATKTSGTVVPASVTVAVLNGTSTANLAHDIMSKLTGAGFKQGAIATAPDQTLTSTIVGYLPSYRRDALAVAKSLKLGSASVQGVDQSNRAVACGGSTSTCPTQVVVTVGTDLAAQA